MGERNGQRSAREDAPSREEYRDLIRTTERLDGDDLILTFAIRVMGELGLRGGEVSHMRRSWIDFERKRILIPSYDPCDHGRGGDVCGYCRSQAVQAVNNRPEERCLEDMLKTRWKPKNRPSNRTVPYSFDDDLVELFDDFFRLHDRFPRCRSFLNSKVSMIAEESELIDNREDVYPHAFRGHAGRRFVRRGMGPYQLTKLMGWASVESAMPYIKMEAQDVEEELLRIFNRQY